MKKVCIALCMLTLVLASCDKDKSEPLSVEPSSLKMFTEETQKITVKSSGDVTYESEDEFYASVAQNGMVTANKVGETNIKVYADNSVVKVPVTVKAKYNLYPDLVSLIGSTESEMERVLGNKYTRSVDGGETKYIYQQFNNYVFLLGSIFEKGKCTSMSVVVPTTYTSMFADYLAERYTVAGRQEDIFLFIDHNNKVIIGLSVMNASYLMAIYIPREGTKVSMGIDCDVMETIQKYCKSMEGLME